MKVLIESLTALENLANEMASALKAGDVFLLEGDLGAGKTTFVSLLCKALKVTDPVSSPTFSLIHRYDGPQVVLHMDLYRLDNALSLDQMDLEYYLGDASSIKCIEWASRLGDDLPANYVAMSFAFGEAGGESRVLSFDFVGDVNGDLETVLQNWT